YGELFGEEYDPEEPFAAGRTNDNTTLLSDDFINRSSMGQYEFNQQGRSEDFNPFPPKPGYAVIVEDGVDIRMAQGGSLAITAGDRIDFRGSVRTEGGSIALTGASLKLSPDTVLSTRGGWYNDFEIDQPVPLHPDPRIDAGDIVLAS